MEIDQHQARSLPKFAILLSLLVTITLVFSLVPVSTVEAVTCKYKHTVQPGDTLMYIANLYTVDWLDIAKANNLNPPYTITVGTVLCIPGGTAPADSGSTGGKKEKAQPVLTVLPSFNQVLVSVENFLPKTPYYVRVFPRLTGVSYRIGNFTTNKDGDWTGYFRLPRYVPRTPQMAVCVKNTWTDAVSCAKYDDTFSYVPAFIRFHCNKEGR